MRYCRSSGSLEIDVAGAQDEVDQRYFWLPPLPKVPAPHRASPARSGHAAKDDGPLRTICGRQRNCTFMLRRHRFNVSTCVTVRIEVEQFGADRHAPSVTLAFILVHVDDDPRLAIFRGHGPPRSGASDSPS